jgi:signal transduction histidine kinase
VTDKASTIDQAAVAPLDFIAASRRILHLANRGPGRIEFLREASQMLLDFSGCEALELWADLGSTGIRYRWSAGRSPGEIFKFEALSPRLQHEESPASSLQDPPAVEPPADSWFDELTRSVMGGRLAPKSRNVTGHGSFWTGDAAADLALSTFSSPAGADFPLCSLAVIPFEVKPSAHSVLALFSGRKHVFSAINMEFYEALAQTLGLAIDDRRAQHALRERVKELSCLYAIAQLLEFNNASIPATLEKIVGIMLPAWQFPESLAVRICLDDRAFSNREMSQALHRQTAPILVEGVNRGSVQVGYLEDRPEFVEGPFLKEEEHLIAAIAREIAMFVQRCEVHQEKQRLAEQVRQADRLATIGQLAAGVAHEINEPLGAILGFAQLARKTDGLPDRAGQDLDKIVQSVLYAREIVRKLMLFARQSTPTRTWVHVNEMVEESLALLASRFKEHRVEVVRDLQATDAQVFADAVQLHQVVVNLCVNGVQAMPKGGRLTVQTRRVPDAILIAVQDAGSGIPEEIADRIFEPFFTTKNPDEGTGLGLALVHGIVTAHQGTVRFETQVGAGTRFEISLPTSPPISEKEDRAGHA